MSTEAPQHSLRGIRVLVVDDEEDVCETIAAALVAYGAEVRCVMSVADARSCLRAQSFDVLLTDIRMPRETGYDLLHDIRSCPESATLPVAAVTATLDGDERQRMESAGFDLILAKPFELDTLVSSVVELARLRRPL